MLLNVEVNKYYVLKLRWCEYQQLLNAIHSHSIASMVVANELILLFIRFEEGEDKKISWMQFIDLRSMVKLLVVVNAYC